MISFNEAKRLLQKHYPDKTICPTYSEYDGKYYSGYYSKGDSNGGVLGVSVDKQTGKIEELSEMYMLAYELEHDVLAHPW